jgi:hypothetical protein
MRLPERIQRTVSRAKYGITIGSIPVDVVERLVEIVEEQWQQSVNAEMRHTDVTRKLEREIMHLGGCFDRRGLEGDPPGIIVQHGIHTVVEDAS